MSIRTVSSTPPIIYQRLCYTDANNHNRNIAVNDDTKSTSPLTDPKPITPETPKKKPGLSKKKRIILLSTAGVIFVAVAAITWLVLANNKQSDEAATKDQSSASKLPQYARLGVGVTVIDGTVTYQKSNDVQTAPNAGDRPWHDVTAATELKEGDQVRTGNGSRAVLTLDDGSAIRLDANSIVRLTSLIADDVVITHLSGTIYSRVVTSDRKYSVVVADTTYQALGTAFTTVKKAGENGVQVYQSSVSANGQNIPEGKQYYSMNIDTSLQGKVTDINIDSLIDNEFIAWNATEDEKDAAFKDKLGILPSIKKRAEEKKAEEYKTKEAADKAEKEQKAAEEKKKQQNKPTAKVTRGTMSLNLSGEQFTWSYTGKAVHGYKLVISKTNPSPVFNGPETQSIYFSGINQLTGTIPGPEKIGTGTFYVTVCAYTANTEAEPCVDYSPVITFVRS